MADGRGLESDLLYAIWAVELLLDFGAGLETAIKHVAEGGYGEVSERFKEVLSETQGGAYLGDSLLRLHDRTSSRGFKGALLAMARSARGESSDLAQTLRKIAEVETRVRRTRIETFVKKLDTITEVYISMALLIPILVVVFLIVQGMVASAGQLAPTGGASLSSLGYVAFGINLVVLIGMLYAVKSMEPAA